MAVKKPLVITNGQIEQLQSGDSIASPELISMTNANAGSMVIGNPVFCSVAGSVDKARANTANASNVIGFCADVSVSTGNPAAIQLDGVLAATTGQWDAVAGTSGGLAAGTIYYLSESTAGAITSTAPSTTGQYVVELGIAISTTELRINIRQKVKL